MPACRTLDTISIFALTVPDAWAAFRAACAFDPADAYSRTMPAPPLGAIPPVLTIAVPDAATREFFGDAAQAASFDAALARLASLGARITEIDFTPFFDVAKMLYEGAWVAERMTVVEDLMRRDPGALHPVTAKIIGAADRLSAADAFRGIYRLADLRRRAEALMAGADLLCVPSIPTFYSRADLEADPVGPEQPVRHLHELRQPHGPLRDRGPHRPAQRRPPRQRHAPRPRGAGCAGVRAGAGASREGGSRDGGDGASAAAGLPAGTGRGARRDGDRARGRAHVGPSAQRADHRRSAAGSSRRPPPRPTTASSRWPADRPPARAFSA